MRAAIYLKTESEDNYLIASHKSEPYDIAYEVFRILGDELAYVYEVQAVSDEDINSESIEAQIWKRIEEMQHAG